VTGTPARDDRRSLAAAGVRPSRRPRPPRRALSLAALAAVALASLSGCGANAPAASRGAAFRADGQASLRQLDQAVAALYRGHPGISTYAVQDVQYTAQSRATVWRECTSPADPTAGDAQAVESGQLVACAPLIFFLYRYGRDASVPAATALAGELYGYAITHISGPTDARASLDELLRSWGLPAPALTPAQARSALRASVFTAADDSILGQKSVHIAITGRKPGSTAAAEKIAADIGTATGTESITSGTAAAQIRVTPKAAYFTGNAAGLTSLLGLPSAVAARAGSRWVVMPAGTAEYQDLAAEDTIASLPASILPANESAAGLQTASVDGRKVYVLRWTTPATGSSPAISERLILDATAQALPVSETTTAGGFSQTVTLSQWGETFAVPAPSSTVPYTTVKS
jgi:hypothetical protein